MDAFPLDPRESVNSDGTGTGDNADPDDDNDGLSDRDERELGTDPLNSDTDGDGLSDAAEVEIGTNPLEYDSDGDGLDDQFEVAVGADPLNADSDNDGVSDRVEWINKTFVASPNFRVSQTGNKGVKFDGRTVPNNPNTPEMEGETTIVAPTINNADTRPTAQLEYWVNGQKTINGNYQLPWYIPMSKVNIEVKANVNGKLIPVRQNAVWLFNPWWGALLVIAALGWIMAAVNSGGVAATAAATTKNTTTAVTKKRGRGRPPKKK